MSLDDAARRTRPEHTGVTWFELFYDLVIVAAVTSGGKLFVDDPTVGDGSFLAGTFLIAIVIWFSTTMNFNLAPGHVPGRRIILLFQMFAVVLVTLAVGRGEALPDWVGLLGVAFIFFTVAALFAMTRRAHPQARGFTVVAWVACLAGVIVVPAAWISRFSGGWAAALLLIGTGILAAVLAMHCLPRAQEWAQIDAEHLTERLGQLVIIVLGETFLSLVLTLGGLAAIPSPLFFVLAFVTSYAMWVIYFASVTPVSTPDTSGRLRLWLASAGIFLFGATFSAEALARSAAHTWAELGIRQNLAPLPVLYVLIGALALALIGRDRRITRVHAVAIGALVIWWLASLLVPALTENWVRLIAFAILLVDAALCRWTVRSQHRAD